MLYNISKNQPHSKGTINPASNFLLKKAKEIYSESNDSTTTTFYRLHNNIVAVHKRYKSHFVSDTLTAATPTELEMLRTKKVC